MGSKNDLSPTKGDPTTVTAACHIEDDGVILGTQHCFLLLVGQTFSSHSMASFLTTETSIIIGTTYPIYLEIYGPKGRELLELQPKPKPKPKPKEPSSLLL